LVSKPKSEESPGTGSSREYKIRTRMVCKGKKEGGVSGGPGNDGVIREEGELGTQY